MYVSIEYSFRRLFHLVYTTTVETSVHSTAAASVQRQFLSMKRREREKNTSQRMQLLIVSSTAASLLPSLVGLCLDVASFQASPSSCVRAHTQTHRQIDTFTQGRTRQRHNRMLVYTYTEEHGTHGHIHEHILLSSRSTVSPVCPIATFLPLDPRKMDRD